jgi:hypothetical protein
MCIGKACVTYCRTQRNPAASTSFPPLFLKKGRGRGEAPQVPRIRLRVARTGTSLDAVIANYETSGKEWPGVLCS